MTATPETTAPARTAGALLFASREEAVEELAGTLVDQRLLTGVGAAIGRLTAAATSTLGRGVADVAADALNRVDLADVLVAGWQQYGLLAEAAWRTLNHPGSEELVDLAAHRMIAVRRPGVDVLVDGRRVGTVELELTCDALVRGLVAIVRDGRLTALEGGRCRLGATLSSLGITLAARETEVAVGALVHLGAGVPLVPARGHIPAPP